MFQETLLRVRAARSPAILCNHQHIELVRRDLDGVHMTADVIVLEPLSRNTAPAAALIARYYQNKGRDEILLFLPSDHKIGKPDVFHAALDKAFPLAEAGSFVLFGEKPTTPDTGYGYIKTHRDSLNIAFFHEKPPVEKAAEYIHQGCYWNTGIIMVRTSVLIEAFRANSAQIWNIVMSLSLPVPEKETFECLPDISIDYALLEALPNKKLLPVCMEWADIGTIDRLKALA